MRIGAACMLLHPDGEKIADHNMRTTTVAKVATLDSESRLSWIREVVNSNLATLENQIRFVGALPPELRLFRISSGLLPLFTHPIAAAFYAGIADTENRINRLKELGILARSLDVRLSFHPGQFVVLGSQTQRIRENAIKELQYHCDVFTDMGYAGWHDHGIAVNVHVGPKDAAVKEMRELIANAPENLQNFLTLENDEYSWGTARITETFGDMVAIVLDIHHHWINAHSRLEHSDPLVKSVKSTWRGVQPKLHHAMSHPEMCTSSKELHLDTLLSNGYTKSKLRAHTLEPWNNDVNKYALGFGFDVMWEGKNKNLGALQLYDLHKANVSK